MPPVSTLAFVFVVLTAMVILVFRDWRIVAGALGLQYIGVFILVFQSWPIGLAIVKLIVGWVATAAIALTYFRQVSQTQETEPAASFFFRSLAGLVVILVIFLVAPDLQAALFPAIDIAIIQGGSMIIGLALMQLGTTSDPYLTVISLLSMLAGFEIIHAALELSTLLTGLLAVTNLGLALIGIYFIVKSGNRENLA